MLHNNAADAHFHGDQLSSLIEIHVKHVQANEKMAFSFSNILILMQTRSHKPLVTSRCTGCNDGCIINTINTTVYQN